jgi:G8 domain
VVNGFNKSKNLVNNTIILTPSRCVGSCLTGLQSVATEDKVRLWSDPKSWTSGKVPIEGESVDIEPGWNMEFDLENSPVFKFIRVNGRLSFKRGMDLQLNAKHIFVRAGELLIGNETHPFLNKAVIKLYGEKNFE